MAHVVNEGLAWAFLRIDFGENPPGPFQDINLDEARELVDEERDRDLPGVFFGTGPGPSWVVFLGFYVGPGTLKFCHQGPVGGSHYSLPVLH